MQQMIGNSNTYSAFTGKRKKIIQSRLRLHCFFVFSLNKTNFYKSKQSFAQADGYAAILNEELQNIPYFI